MDGEIDMYLHRWRNMAGEIAHAPVGSFGQNLCPMCRLDGRDHVLARLPGLSAWGCEHQHRFQDALIPNEREP
jgi:hypothetical protein